MLCMYPLLHSSRRTPAKHMASNAYVLVNAALMVFFEQAQSPSVAAVALDCLKHILSSMSMGKPLMPCMTAVISVGYPVSADICASSL